MITDLFVCPLISFLVIKWMKKMDEKLTSKYRWKKLMKSFKPLKIKKLKLNM